MSQQSSQLAAAPSTEISQSAPYPHLSRSSTISLFLGAFSFLLYSGALAFKFVYDDRTQIVGNAAITSWSYVGHYFDQNVWQLINPHKLANYYRPIFLLWLKLNYSLFGHSPAGWHALCVLLQVLATLQIFWLGKRLFKADLPAAVSALVFAVHPVHIESVAWVSGATDPLVAVFMLAALLAFLRFLESPGGRNWVIYALSLVFASLALLSKEVAVVLPVLLVATALVVHRGDGKKTLIWKYACPFFILTLVYLFVRQSVLQGFSHSIQHYSTHDLLLTLPLVIWFYARQLVFPFWIAPYANVYWVHSTDARHFWIPLVICVAIVLVCVITLRLHVDRRTLGLSYAWIALPLLPALYIKVFSPFELVHDRYLYLSTIGFSILAGIIFLGAAQRFSPRLVQSVAALVLVAFASLTFTGELNWASDVLLFTHAVKIAPENDEAMLNLGIAYLENNHPEEGSAALKLVCDRNPNYALAAYNLGYYFSVNRRDREAEDYLRRALALDPTEEGWQVQFAAVELRLGKVSQAEEAVREAIARRPDGQGFHLVLGAVLLSKGDRSGAEEAFEQELREHPDEAPAKHALEQLKAAAPSATGARKDAD